MEWKSSCKPWLTTVKNDLFEETIPKHDRLNKKDLPICELCKPISGTLLSSVENTP